MSYLVHSSIGREERGSQLLPSAGKPIVWVSLLHGPLCCQLWLFYVMLTFSKCWVFFGKLWEARSRLRRSRLLQVSTRLKAVDEIYKINTLVHRSNIQFKISAKFLQTVSQFCSCIFEKRVLLICFHLLSKIHQCWLKIFRMSASLTEKIKYPRLVTVLYMDPYRCHCICSLLYYEIYGFHGCPVLPCA